jgi:hypothetical protein
MFRAGHLELINLIGNCPKKGLNQWNIPVLSYFMSCCSKISGPPPSLPPVSKLMICPPRGGPIDELLSKSKSDRPIEPLFILGPAPVIVEAMAALILHILFSQCQ